MVFFADLLPILSSRTVILASGSPRRREILEKLAVPFSVVQSNFPENLDKRRYVDRPFDYVVDNARQKALDVYQVEAEKSVEGKPLLVIGCDTVVSFEGVIYEKPRDPIDAFSILSRLNGRTHEVYSGVALVAASDTQSGQPQIEEFYEQTRVKFGQLNEALIRAYVETEEPLDKAGAYGIQGRGAVLVERIEGDFYNVQGFPLFRFVEHLLRLFPIADK